MMKLNKNHLNKKIILNYKKKIQRTSIKQIYYFKTKIKIKDYKVLKALNLIKINIKTIIMPKKNQISNKQLSLNFNQKLEYQKVIILL